MKILHISPEAPGYYSGGRLAVMQTTYSITSSNEVDYVGPPIENLEIKNLYKNVHELGKCSNPFLIFISVLRGITNRSYYSWLALNLNFDEYDRVILEFSKQDYILDKIDAEKLIVHVHNVEVDFANIYYKVNKNVKNYIVKVLQQKQESKLLNASQKVVALTEKDKNRLIELYDVDYKKISVIPISVQNHGNINSINDGYMLITGSLWYGTNYQGIKWFIEKVYNNLVNQPKLVIAGSRPNDELKRLVATNNRIELIDSPNDMSPYFEKAALAIAPIFDGAGMKVKVAEALSYGLPVLGTEHAFIGYEVINGENSYLGRSEDEFIAAIEDYFSLSSENQKRVRKNAFELFEKYYSFDSSRNLWNKVLLGIN